MAKKDLSKTEGAFEETPEQARKRWEREESGPGGILSQEGISGGGIFGSGAIPTPTTDPAGEHRGAQTRAWERIALRLEGQIDELVEENRLLRKAYEEQHKLIEQLEAKQLQGKSECD